jgi:predicted GNAT family acetyltransferase
VSASEDDKLDEALEETFPASDPPCNTVETGIDLSEITSAPSSEIVVRDHPEANRLEAVVDGHTAFLTYERGPQSIALVHTEVPEPVRGRGIATRLAESGIEFARATGLALVVRCPLVREYLRKHPEAARS